MKANTKTASDSAIRQAELIIRLYDLRRESVMRKARSYVGGDFMPSSADELIELVTAGGKRSGYILQVYGYWDMVAAFVHNGALEAKLIYDTCQEMYFQYAKIQPYLAEFRQKMNLPEWMTSLESVIEDSPSGRDRIATMQKNIAAIAKARAESTPATP